MAQTPMKRKAKRLGQDNQGTRKDKTVTRRARKKGCKICRQILALMKKPPEAIRALRKVELGTPTQILGSNCKRHSKLVSRCFGANLSRVHQDPITLRRIRYYAVLIVEGSKRIPAVVSGRLQVASQSLSPLGGRLVNAKWIDYGLPRRWKERCNAEHTCISSKSVMYTTTCLPVWVVDTWKQCLVRCSTSTPYVALSYVWGGTTSFTALKNNIQSLQNPGSLAEDSMKKIPRTIRDAMAFVQILGERYLWVDSLCIEQDHAQKMVHIANMGAIYAQASITIIAADGGDADSGLRGFHGLSGPRSVKQVVHSFGRGKALIESFNNPNRISAWGARAWTFQEDLFSRRKVLFKEGWIRWVCREAIWDEHGDAGTPRPRIFNQLVPNIKELGEMIREFNCKRLTFPEDLLFAFSGIASELSKVFRGGFISGLPVSLFSVVLLWEPPLILSRRVPKRAAERHYLPSWSWAGWEGLVTIPMRGDMDNYEQRINSCLNHERVSSLVEWSWTNIPQGPRTRIHESWQNHRETFLNKFSSRCPPGWTRYSIEDPYTVPPWKIDRQPQPGARPLCFYKHESEPHSEFWYPPPMPRKNEPTKPHILARYITCRTRRGRLISGKAIVHEKRAYPENSVSLRDQRGNWAGALIPHEPIGNGGTYNNRAREEQTTKIEMELVEIAQGSVFNDRPYPPYYIKEWELDERPKSGALYEYFYVLWIEWKEGIAYRKGIGRVHKHAWESQPLEWIDLILG